ncbi:Beta-lactamase-like domain-containing protein [Aphelenchoides besseyi]|nr:Beta-lactamase-like domain-containing protein [Aphelenchoides besseyi]
MRTFLLLIGLFVLTTAIRPRKNRQWRQLRPNCGSLDSLIKSYPRYPDSGPSQFPSNMFPFPFFARPGFRGLGIPNEVILRRMGRPCEGPVIEPLTSGVFELEEDTLRVTAGTTLITDEKRESGDICLILVDTGSSNQRMPILGGLSSVGVRPEYINNVVLTHMDLDSTGNLNLFPDANVYVGNRRAKQDTVFFPRVAPQFDQSNSGLPFTRLCDNTFLYLTPGFSADDLSVVVRNVAGYGTVSIVGNLIIDEDDAKNDRIIPRFAQNSDQKSLWESSRKEIICMSDYIIPGTRIAVNCIV